MSTARLPIEDQFPVRDWSKLQLFSLNTPNGVKVGVALEELGLAYEPHTVRFTEGAQRTETFRTISPNGKIPVLIDPRGPDQEPLVIMESGAILLHLAEKTERLIPSDETERSETLQWLFFQVGHIGPMFGQLGHFHRQGRELSSDDYALDRYLKETQRLLGVLETRLEGRTYLVAEQYTLADIAIFPWIRTLLNFYAAGELVGFQDFPRTAAWYERLLRRPSTQAGILVCGDR